MREPSNAKAQIAVNPDFYFRNGYVRKAEVYGERFDVPEWVAFVAIDLNGDLYGYEFEPAVEVDTWQVCRGGVVLLRRGEAMFADFALSLVMFDD
ncbi:MAG: hypothetical protein OEY63_07045 [Gemmatimonadota bacterium]|nr:hypothetical protein [Gemmatimonadota bacterium]